MQAGVRAASTLFRPGELSDRVAEGEGADLGSVYERPY